MKKLTAIVFSALFSSAALAGDLSGTSVLGEIRVGSGIIKIGTEGNSWNDPDNCSGNQSGQSGQLYLLESSASFKEIYSAVLAARISRIPVQFYVNGCHTAQGKTHPIVTALYL